MSLLPGSSTCWVSARLPPPSDAVVAMLLSLAVGAAAVCEPRGGGADGGAVGGGVAAGCGAAGAAAGERSPHSYFLPQFLTQQRGNVIGERQRRAVGLKEVAPSRGWSARCGVCCLEYRSGPARWRVHPWVVVETCKAAGVCGRQKEGRVRERGHRGDGAADSRAGSGWQRWGAAG